MTAEPEDDSYGARGRGDVLNRIAGGVFLREVVQGRDITVVLPPRVDPALSGLPPRSPAFTGRDSHLSELLRGLAPGRSGPQAAPVTAVAGLAGVGKTELAVQTAAYAVEQPGWFPGGVLFTDLFGYDPDRRVAPEHALDGWLRALGVPADHIPTEPADRTRMFRSILAAYANAGRRILLVIDNACSADQAHPLLPTDGVTAALVTSRHTLDLGARLHDLDRLTVKDGVELLRRSLGFARGPSETRVDDEPDAAASIAELCAGLPLALQIASTLLADTPAQPLADLAQLLEAEHTRLDQLSREERAVRVAFDLSYKHLGPEHARLFRLLPLNVGPDISTEAASHLIHARIAGTSAPDTAKLLKDLARAHLIEPSAAWGRWRMHDLVRLYADQHTDHAGDQRSRARARLHHYYVSTAKAADTHLAVLPGTPHPRFRDRDQALAWLDSERLNLMATAVAAPASGNPDAAVDLVFALARYLDFRRHFEDLIAIAAAALAVFHDRKDRHGEAMAQSHIGVALQRMRRFDEAITAHTSAADICRELGDRRGEADAWTNLGAALQEVRRFDEAITFLTDAASAFHDLGDRHGEATVGTNLGAALQEVRRLDEAITALTDAVDVYRDLGDRHGEAMAQNNLGTALRESGRSDEAITAHKTAADIYRELGDRHGEAVARNNLGSAHRETRRFDDAVRAHITAADTYRDLGDRHHEAIALTNLGTARRDVGQIDEAIVTLTDAVGTFRSLGDRYNVAHAQTRLGAALQQVGRFDEAVITLTPAVDTYRDFDDRIGQAGALDRLGCALREVGRFEEAFSALTDSAAAYHELGDPLGEAMARTNMGIALGHLGRFTEAISALAASADTYQQLGYHRLFQAVLALRADVEQEYGYGLAPPK